MAIMFRRLALVFALGAMLPAAPLHAAMDEASLVQAWEAQMRADSGTLVLEPIGEGVYRFETERFPYVGEIHILNTDIYHDAYTYGENFAMGVVELELTGLPDDFFMKHSTSYYNWERNNTLYYDIRNDAWLSESQWANAWAEEEYPESVLGVCGLGWDTLFWIGFLLLLIIFFLFLGRKTSRQMKTAMSAQDQALKGQEEALALTREAIALQREALDVLRDIRDRLGKAD